MSLPVLHSTPALKPTELSEMTARAVNELLREGQSHNTLTSYRAALRYWAAWFGLRYGSQIALPVPAPAVLQFIVDHAQRTTERGLRHELPAAIDTALVERDFKGKTGPLALATLKHRLYVLSKAHADRDVVNPVEHPRVKELLAMTVRAYAKRGERPLKKDALTREPLQALLATCDDTLKGKRDRALLLFAWASGGRRRSEVSSAHVEFLRRIGPLEFSYELGHSKTNQAGVSQPHNHKPIVGTAAQALEEWLRAAGIHEGPLFRRVFRGGRLGDGLSAAAVREIVRGRAALAGIEGDYSAHSLRSGFVTEATLQSAPLAQTMAMSGHTSVQSVIGYTHLPTLNATAARLFDSGKS